MSNTIRDYVIKRSSFTSLEEYEKEVATITNNLLLDRARLLHLEAKDLNDPKYTKKYNIGVDTFVPYSDMSRTAKVYKAFGIKMLIVETSTSYTKLILPVKEVDYSKSIGESGSINFIPSTTDFINSFNPTSGYNKPQK